MADRPASSNELAEVVGPNWTEGKVIAAMGVSPETVTSWREDGAILALPTRDGALVYPTAQFERRQGTVVVRPALLPFLQALRRFDPWAVAVLLHTPTPELDGKTPLEWLSHHGEPAVLSRLAQTVAREWAAGTPPM